jgi:modulator of FtsH protease HflC
MNAPRILIPLAIVAITLYSSAFTVGETETAILFRLGEIKRADFEPGLHFKIPVINNVKKFDDRILTLDFEPQRFLTKEKKDVIVDLFLKWRIKDVASYYRATGGDERRAGLLVYQWINDFLRGEFGRLTVKEVVSGERGAIMKRVTAAAQQHSGELGLKVVDVRIKRIDLPTEVSAAVYNRMRAERERTARDLRSRGAEAGERIRADADREQTQILAEAYRVAQKTRGEGDAKATAIYASAYGKDPEFYAFWGSLDAYSQGLKGKDDLLVLEPDSQFFKYFNAPGIEGAEQSNGSVASGIR